MRFVDRLIVIVGQDKFKQFYSALQFNLTFEKFKQIPTILQLQILNELLINKYGIMIYTLPKQLYIYKVYIPHFSSHEIKMAPIHMERQMVITQMNIHGIIPTDRELIDAIKPIEHLLVDDPFESTHNLEW